jgi:hypothetical protein
LASYATEHDDNIAGYDFCPRHTIPRLKQALSLALLQLPFASEWGTLGGTSIATSAADRS